MSAKVTAVVTNSARVTINPNSPGTIAITAAARGARGADGDVEEAPLTGGPYGRLGGAWVLLFDGFEQMKVVPIAPDPEDQINGILYVVIPEA